MGLRDIMPVMLAAVSLACGPPQSDGPRPPTPIQAVSTADPPIKAGDDESLLVATYREPANIFEVMDNTSMWFRGKCDPEYQAYWASKYGTTAEDEQSFAGYKEIRKRYYDLPKPEDTETLFGPNKPVDKVAAAFYGATSMQEAFDTLARFMSAADVQVLQRFYDAHASRYRAILSESRAFVQPAAELQKLLSSAKARAAALSVGRFYGMAVPPRFAVLYVWWPPGSMTTANQRGRVLLLKRNPQGHHASPVDDASVALHEFAHYASASQPAEQKRRLAAAFRQKCDPAAVVPPIRVLEEPLAVVHGKSFERSVGEMKFSARWYGGDPWVGVFAKLIFTEVVETENMDEALMGRLGELCKQLIGVGPALKKAAPSTVTAGAEQKDK